ncbi:glycosyltransferase [Thioalkalivibrio sp. ARh3]|uniref:glycosyltransferase family 2 protein n=1 Tax=Thioalkalivibrio sp. ARh3 TaxID=1158148 RepID=UPI00037B5436|nr:glycosyltransferase [Thioalkalivibrio sp. ARh3]
MTTIEEKRGPAVSVVMPVYNGEMFVEASIRSVMAQTFADWELVVVDDASTDGSVARVEARWRAFSRESGQDVYEGS